MIKNRAVPKISVEQNVKISQNTIQLLSMLQMNNFQLESYINDEIEKNPVIEIDSIQNFDGYSVNWREYFNKNRNNYSGEYGLNESEEMESTDSEEETFEDHLISQLYIMKFTENEFKIAVNIIRDLNDNGYLDYMLEDLAELYKVKVEIVEKILERLKTIEPKGTFATGLSECLIMQLDEQSSDYELIRDIIDKNLEDIAEHRYEELLEEYNISNEKLKEIIESIKKLNPIPSSGYSNKRSGETEYILPEIFLSQKGDSFEVEIPETKYTRLNINEKYLSILGDEDDEEAKAYIMRGLDAARALLKNIESRKQTLKKVVEKIAEIQYSFLFEKGELSPLNQDQVAEAVNVSVSTISRAIDGKFVDTPRGIFSLKFFFSNKAIGEDGEISVESVKSDIKNIIDIEDIKKPVSDQRISEILDDRGVHLSRRTVAKYREEMDIPNSSKRKRIKQL